MSQWKLTNFEDLRPGDEFWWTADANGMQEGGIFIVETQELRDGVDGFFWVLRARCSRDSGDKVSFINRGYFWVRASPKPVRFDCRCPHCGGEIKMNVQGGE
jgi:hypothetical protein